MSPNVTGGWACMRHPEKPEEILLPRFGWRGRSRTYLVGAVRAAAGAMMRAKRRKTT